jgi:hypothetical protein
MIMNFNSNDDLPLPLLPSGVPWVCRKLCYVARKLRGYGRTLPALAKVWSTLQEVVVDTDYCGPVCLDLRESVCIPIFVHGCYRHQVPEDRILNHLLKAGMRVFDIGANIGYYTIFISRRVDPKPKN